MLGIDKKNTPCGICSHREVCRNKDIYENFFLKMKDENFKEKPDFVRIEISCIHYDSCIHYNADIRVREFR